MSRQLVGVGDRLLQLGDHPLPHSGVALGGVGVVADDEPVLGVVEADFFDLQVVGDERVAALAGQRLVGFGGAGAQLLTDDVVPAGAA